MKNDVMGTLQKCLMYVQVISCVHSDTEAIAWFTQRASDYIKYIRGFLKDVMLWVFLVSSVISS